MSGSARERQWVAVLGGSKRYTDEQILAAYSVGCELGRLGKNLVTGATTGIPYAAALGAREEGALVLGISPASSSSEHVLRCEKPLDAVDFVVYSGLNVEGRGPLILRSAAAAIFIGGELGTLQEFTAAYMCGNKVLGVLEDMGGISAHLRTFLTVVENNWGNKVLFDSDPVALACRVCREVDLVPDDPCVEQRSDGIGRDVRAVIEAFISQQRQANG
jgi:uncharacterized protein (TIGR00725 family)